MESTKNFEDICNKVKLLKNISQTDQLKFYALYKISTEGGYNKNKDKEIGFFDFEKKAKYQSWKEYSYLSPEEAMREYEKLYFSLDVKRKTEKSKENEQENEEESKSNLNFDFAYVSSTAKEDRKHIEEYLISASNSDCIYYEINNDFSNGKVITKEYFDRYSHVNCKY